VLARSARLTLALTLAALCVTVGWAGAAGSGRGGVGFELGSATVTPGHPLFDGKRKIRLHYRFAARRAIDLRIEIVRLRSGNVVRSWTERHAAPGRKLDRAWDGLTRRGKAAPDGRYEFRIGPPGKAPHRAARLRLRGHVFPVDGPHGTRGAIGEFGAPRSGGRVHEGFDITGDCGTPLLAARGGVVAKTGYDPALYGNYVLIDGAKTSQDTFYAHLIAPSPLHDGERVRTAEELGRIGQTGNAAGTPCHLHFEIRVHGKPIDPEPSLRRWDRYS
jgi:murein DD-endopeptidase MepM/ murein hydrolase activator NlpD